MDLNQLAQFLVQAKLNTYAKSGEEGETILSDDSKQFEFSQADFKYVDNYSGFNPFSGKETVFYQDQLVWEMRYTGEVTDQETDPKKVYEFLKEALQYVTIAKPFRGPNRFEENKYLYINKIEGDIERFQGQELISTNNKQVYQLSYYGGVIK